MQDTAPAIEEAELPTDCRALPDGWTITNLGSLVEFKNGLNYSATAVGAGIKIIGVADFQDYQTPKYDRLQELSGLENLNEGYLLKEGDLLFVRSNGNKDLIGRALLIENLQGRITHSGFTIRARVLSTSVTPRYLAMLVRSTEFKLQIAKHGGGTNISNLSQGILNDVTLLLPPLPEQARIVEILDAAEAALRATESLIEAKTRYKRALAEQLLSGNGKRRFPEFAGQEWREVEIGEMFTPVERPVEWDDEEYYNLISIRRRSEGLFFRGATQGKTIKTKTLKTVHADDFLISRMQVVHGAWGRVSAEFDGFHVSDSYNTLESLHNRVFEFKTGKLLL